MSSEIRLLAGERSLDAFVAHLLRLLPESGAPGELITHPRSREDKPDPVRMRDRAAAAWGLPVREPGWGRCFALVDDDGDISGHLDLKGGSLPSEQHRALLGMGIERRSRRQGHGRALLERAIAWSRAEGLSWLDLGVFAHNAPARALYSALGFAEVGMTIDRFRVDGHVIDDVQMCLRL